LEQRLANHVYSKDRSGRRRSLPSNGHGRISQTATGATNVSEQYVYDGSHLLAVLNPSTGQMVQDYFNGLTADGQTQAFAEETLSGGSSTGVNWMLTDNVGSVKDVVTNASGHAVLDHIVYDSYGNILSQTNSSNDTRIGYAGYVQDKATSRDYANARYYQPTTGRFISQDPSGFAAGDTNLYRYVGNNPTTATDPTGLYAVLGSRSFGSGGLSNSNFYSTTRSLLDYSGSITGGTASPVDLGDGLSDFFNPGSLSVGHYEAPFESTLNTSSLAAMGSQDDLMNDMAASYQQMQPAPATSSSAPAQAGIYGMIQSAVGWLPDAANAAIGWIGPAADKAIAQPLITHTPEIEDEANAAVAGYMRFADVATLGQSPAIHGTANTLMNDAGFLGTGWDKATIGVSIPGAAAAWAFQGLVGAESLGASGITSMSAPQALAAADSVLMPAGLDAGSKVFAYGIYANQAYDFVSGQVAGPSPYLMGEMREGSTTYQTYTKTNLDTGIVYSGRTSGTGTPLENVAARDVGHHMNEQGFGPAVLDRSSPNYYAIRGREQDLIWQNGGAKSEGGTSGNLYNGVSPDDPNLQEYLKASEEEFGFGE
jgi:RHS repeat-associated protein